MALTDGETGHFSDHEEAAYVHVHGADADAARPTLGSSGTVPTVVLWVGSVEPNNATVDDVWWDTSDRLLKRHNGTTFTTLAASRAAAETITGDWTFEGNLWTKADPVVNAKAHGAVGDGTTDDTAAIQAAIDAVAARSGDGVVLLPQGTYLVSASIILKDRVWLVGEGSQATVLSLADGANATLVKSEDFDTLTGSNSTPKDSMGLLHMRLDGNKANNTAGYGAQFYVRGLQVDRVIITDCVEDGLYTEGPSSGAGVGSWAALPPGHVRWLTCLRNGGNGWTHQGHSDMQVGFYHAIINDGHGLHMNTVAGVSRSTMNADHLRISSNGTGADSKGLLLQGTGTDLICSMARLENNGAEGLRAETGTHVRIGQLQLLQNCKAAGVAQVVLDGAHWSSIDHLLLREPWTASTGGVRVVDSNRVTVRGLIDGTPDPNGPDSGVANTGRGLVLVGSATRDCLFDVHIRNHDGTGGIGLQSGSVSGVVNNLVRATIKNCDTAWHNTNAGTGNRYDINADLETGQSTIGGIANPGVAEDWSVRAHDGTAEIFHKNLLEGQFGHRGDKVGFFSTTPVTQPSVPAAGTVTADDLRQALIDLGLVS